ncbi:MAG: hypothetical protein IJL89_02605 [Firmicutes bacterium]|nr:hypothetical protein [Bacillota bacterium]
MKHLKTIMAIAAAALMTGCGGTAANNSAETSDKTDVAAEAETAEETAADTEDGFFGNENSEAEERLIPVTYEGDFEYNGTVFKTMSDVFAASGDEPNVGSSGNQFICVIENDDICARFIANMPADMAQKLYDLDILDDNYRQNELNLVKDLEIARVDDLKAGVLSQTELDKYINNTVSELEDAGFEMSGWSVVDTEGEFSFDNGYYEYTATFNEPLSEGTDYDEAGATDGFTVKSMTYAQLSYKVFDTDDLLE